MATSPALPPATPDEARRRFVQALHTLADHTRRMAAEPPDSIAEAADMLREVAEDVHGLAFVLADWVRLVAPSEGTNGR